ncbi:MAG: Spy/CpxP family protein refolding chaperone [Acidobacteriota bacterium]
MPRGSRQWMWLTLALTLVLGMSVGILLDRWVLDPHEGWQSRGHRHRDRGERLLSRLDEELGLSAEQRARLEKLLADNREKAHAFWKETRDAYSQLRQEFRHQIRALLSAEQQERFDELYAEEGARRSRDRREQ